MCNRYRVSWAWRELMQESFKTRLRIIFSPPELAPPRCARKPADRAGRRNWKRPITKIVNFRYRAMMMTLVPISEQSS